MMMSTGRQEMIDATGSVPAPRWPFAALLAIMGLICLWGGRFGPIGAHPLALPGPQTWGGTINIPAAGFMGLYAATWVTCGLLMTVFPRGLSTTRAVTVILAAAAVCRVALLPHPPSDDVNRYLWEGRLIREGINPYHQAPENPHLAAIAREDPYHAGINHPEIPAAYPPLALGLFAAAGAAAYHPLAVKAMVLFFDMATLAVVLALLRRRGLDPRWAMLYGFNPLVLYGFAAQGHFDAILTFFLTATVAFYDRRRWGWMFLCLGLAVQSKYIAVVAAPFFLRRENLGYLWVALTAALIPFLPFVARNPERVFNGLVTFGRDFAFNGPIHAPLRALLGGIPAATIVTMSIFAITTLAACIYFHPQINRRYTDDPLTGSMVVIGLIIVLSPTVHYWYLTWILPFLAVRPLMSWWMLSLSAGFYFLTVGISYQTGRWHLPPWGFMAQWLPFYLLLAREVFLFCRHQRVAVGPHPPRSVSVVIPVRNESDRIQGCLSAIDRDPAVAEMIVIDGGSEDDTAAKALGGGARVISHLSSPREGGGRGGQIAHGVRVAKGDVVAVVHADTRVAPQTFSRIIQVLSRQTVIIGGAVGSQFAARGFHWRLLEWANDTRAAFAGISFGDQIQFFRRRPLAAPGMFPALPLMEDVELSLRLGRMGRRCYLFGSALVSPRRWQADGFGHTFLVLRLMAAYLWQRIWTTPNTLAMYRRYYQADD